MRNSARNRGLRLLLEAVLLVVVAVDEAARWKTVNGAHEFDQRPSNCPFEGLAEIRPSNSLSILYPLLYNGGMIPHCRVLLVGLLCLLYLGRPVVTAQDPALRLKVDVPLVTLDVSVLDPSGRPLTNLTQEDFQIFEDGQQREIKNFSSVETPYHILALFDCTDSTREAWPFLLKSLNSFFTTLRPQDRIGVLAFGGGTSVILNWTSRGAEPLNVQMRMPSPLCDHTNFYGALTSTAAKMQDIAGRKGVIVFTDGVHGGIPSKPARIGRTTIPRFVDPSEYAGFLAARRAIERSETVF